MRRQASSATQLAASDLLPAANIIHLHTAARPEAGLRKRVNITRANLSKLVCPSHASEKFFWDAQVPGLALRAYRGGKRIWVIQYRDAEQQTRRLNLGNADAIEPPAARRLARETLLKVAGGANPSRERKLVRTAPRFGELVERYLDAARGRQKASSFDHTQRNLRKYAAPMLSSEIGTIDRLRIHTLHQQIGKSVGEVQANRVVASLSAMWVWSLRTGLIMGDNPCALVPRFTEMQRERVLTTEELRLIWICTGYGRDFDRIVRLLILTACRRQEVGSMQWEELHGDLWTIPSSRMKRARPHEVPLSSLAAAQLPTEITNGPVFGRGADGFDGWSRAKARLDKDIARTRHHDANGGPTNLEKAPAAELYLPAWGLHDLRRTFSTIMHERGMAEPHIIEALLAHQGAQAGIAGVYNKAGYRDPKRAALDNWADFVQSVVVVS